MTGRPRLDQRGFVWALAAILLAFVILRSGLPLEAAPWQGYDDGLFFRGFAEILQGDWLGKYDNLTLAKGPFLSMMAAVSSGFGIPAKTAEAMLYAASAGLFGLVAVRLGMSRLAALATVVLLLGNPHVWLTTRFLRDVVYSAQALALLSLVALLLFGCRTRRGRVLCAVATGLVAGSMAINREEHIWMALVVLGLVGLRGAAFAIDRGWRGGGWGATALLPVPFVALGAFVAMGPVLVLNKIHYKRAIVSEFRAPEFEAAVGALMRVEPHHESRYVAISRDALERAAGVSPRAAEVRDVWDGVIPQWEWAGTSLVPDAEGEIAGSWVVWALRDAAADAGHHVSAPAAQAFYAALAEEVNAACDSGELACSRRRDTLAPPLRAEDFDDFLRATGLGLQGIALLSGDQIVSPRSTGDREALDVWARFVGPVVIPPRREVSGWIAYPAFAPKVRVVPGRDVGVGAFTLRDADGIADALAEQGKPNLGVTSFVFDVACEGPGCILEASSWIGQSEEIALDGIRRGELDLPEPWQGYIDRVRVLGADGLHGFVPPTLEPASLATGRALTALSQSVTPVLVLLGILGALAAVPGAVRDPRERGLFALCVGAAAAVLLRAAIVAYIDVTAWTAVNVGYLGPAYPFAIVFGGTGTYLLARTVMRRFAGSHVAGR